MSAYGYFHRSGRISKRKFHCNKTSSRHFQGVILMPAACFINFPKSQMDYKLYGNDMVDYMIILKIFFANDIRHEKR